jgi:hypothetical protein
MLTEKEYQELWVKHFSHSLTKEKMPSYSGYKTLFGYYEEYLKHFRDNPIRYILVAEAPPKGGAYVYNYKLPSGLNSPYFKQVIKAFGINSVGKLDTEEAKAILAKLAKEGVLILDLFPFAITYTGLRKKLISRGVLKEFWDGPVYSIKTQIEDLCTKHEIKLHDKWDLCLIAPPTLSEHIVAHFSALVVKPCGSGNHNNTTFHALHPHPSRKTDWKKVAVSKASYPSAALIKIAFDIK